MASGSRVPYRDLYNKLNNDDLNYLIGHLKSYLFGDVDFDLNLMYEKAYKMVHNGHSDYLYASIRSLLIEYMDNLARKLEDFKTNNFLIALNDLWFEILKKAEVVRDVLLYSERVFETSVTGGTITHFIWNIFCETILENSNFEKYFELKEEKCEESQKKCSLAKDMKILNLINIENDIKSNILNMDCLLDVFSFLSTSQIGKFSLISSQMEKFCNYLLNKRSFTLCPIKIVKEWRNNFYGIYQLNYPRKRLGNLILPLESLPVWINGIETIQFINPNIDCIEFLYLFKDYLNNCHLLFGQTSIWKNLHEIGQLFIFFKLFNNFCFSFEQKLENKFFDKKFGIMGEIFPFMFPLWAIFNGIFLKELRDMEFQLEFLYFNGSSFLKWLHHPSNENKPRRLKLFTGNNECKIILDISSLIQKLKEVYTSSLRYAIP
uniref:F-box domain-containing protein n=1 Tax=Meloidogyne incognita TaxID=6306 RepID=A0A914MH09_MELIC